MMDYDVLVIGAGAGGLSAGASLASRGLKTLVLEQNNFVGGCCSSFENQGYYFDVGACIIELPRIHDWFYRGLGLRREDYLTFLKNEPIYELVDVLSGERVLVPSSLEGFAEIIARHSTRDARTFLDFMRRQFSVVDRFCDIILTTPQGRFRDLFKVFARYPRILTKMKYVMTPYGKLMNELFEHPYTHRLLTTYSVIGGLPPSKQTSLMMWLCYTEHDEGMLYPRGGMGAVPRGMARALTDLGGELRLGAKVKKIILDKKKARGVMLSDGTRITSRAVVSNANAKVLYEEMIGEENVPDVVIRGLNSYDYSPSCTIGYLGLDYRPRLNAQHMIGLVSPELVEGFWSNIYSRDVPVAEGVGLVSSPSYMDPSLAPDGCCGLSFINMAPSKPRGRSWDDIKWDYLDRGINMLDAMYLPGVKDHVAFKTIATPQDFESRLSIPHGSIYAFSMDMLSQMTFRPSNASRCIKDLYLCGASTHMGSVPGAVCSGMMAADLAAGKLNGRCLS